MSILSAFNTARSSLLAQSRALSVASNNVGNVNTPGYTRLRPIFETIPGSSGGLSVGGGASIESIQRVVDATIDLQLQRERQELSYDAEIERGLTSIEGIFEELGGTGISGALSEFFASLGDLANNPANSTVRESVLQAAKNLTSLIHDADRRLDQRQIDANNQLQQSVTEVNAITADLAELNGQIFRVESSGSGAEASALRDRRAALLADLAEHVGFTFFERPDGQISVFVGGGAVLVDDDVSAQLLVQPGAAGNPVFFDIFHDLGGSVGGPITARILGGKMGAAIDLRDNRIQSYRDSLDEFTFTLARRINDEHFGPLPAPPPGDAFGLVDNQSRRFFIDGAQAVTPEGSDFTLIGGAAAAIAIHADILANIRHIAAGAVSIGGAGAATGDNQNALDLAAAELNGSAFFQLARDPVTGLEIPPGIVPGGNAQTLGGFSSSISGRLGSELQSSRRALAQEELVVAELEQRRASISGVSLDEEIANLIRFERAYQASARIIQETNTLIGFLIDMV